MNKSELIAKIAHEADIPKATASKALNGILESISSALEEGDQVSLVGFGTFKVNERKERLGRNPQTGETMKIAATKVPSFSAGKSLKEFVNG
ncbi:HU family DNA-binding protein [Algicola sagamiensis]|uniref:HU family DNA-binding protein n=1 Tax=Algicola sagamiensis TaxID=163869 RepID=UPI000362D1CD|nr:HU family DNA-binding protein [Algicola sagamiensis]